MSSSLLCNIWHFISLWTSHNKLIENCSNTQIVEDCFWRHRLMPKLITRWLSDKEFACQCRRCSSVPGSGSALEEEMPTSSSILAWEIPWTEEPGALQSIGLQRAGHDWTWFTLCATEQKLKLRKAFFSFKSTIISLKISLCSKVH